MKVLVLMAGPDGLFKEAGYTFSKNLVEIEGQPLAQHVLQSLLGLRAGGAEFIVMVRKDEESRDYTGSMIKLLMPEAVVVTVPGLTAGAACTALMAIDHVDNGEPLLIANGDAVLDADITQIVAGFHQRGLDGGIVAFRSAHPRWSHVRVDEEGLVVEAAEKKPISDLATSGHYYFREGRSFVSAVQESIRKDAHVNNAFFVCPCYNELVLARKRIGVHEIPAQAYHSLATPEGVDAYAGVLRARRGGR